MPKEGDGLSKARDDSLVARIKRDDRGALKELISETSTPLYRYAYRYLGDRALARDVLGKAYLQLLKEELDKVEGIDDIRTSLWRIIHKSATREAFSLHKSSSGPEAPRAGTSRKPPAPEYVRKSRSENVQALEEPWQSLDVPYREALALAGIEPLVPYDAASEMLDGTRGTLRSRLAYAIRIFLKAGS